MQISFFELPNHISRPTQYAHSWRGFVEGVLLAVLFTVLGFKWKKHSVAKILLAIWELILHEYNRSYKSYKISDKFAFILFLSFLTNQNQKSSFQLVGFLVMKNISFFLFIANRSLLQSHFEFNKLLLRNFLTCYSCSYYSSMVKHILSKGWW